MTRACRLARRWILQQADGTSSLEDDFRLEEHLRTCTACAAEERRVRTVEEALHALDVPDTTPWNEAATVEASVAGIRRRLQEPDSMQGEAPPERRRRLAVAASLLVSRMNRRLLVLVSVAIVIASNGLCMVFTDYQTVLWLRVGAGFGSGVYTAVAVATLGGAASPRGLTT